MKVRIKKIRKALNLTQQEFADKIGIGRNNIAGYETGRRCPSDAAISLICKTFNVNEDWLRNGGSDDNMFINLTEDEELAMYTQLLLKSKDDAIANIIKEFIIIYMNLNDDVKQSLKDTAKELLDKNKSK